MNGALSLSMKKILSASSGVVLVIILAVIAMFTAETAFVRSTGMSPVVLGIIIGMIFGNTLAPGILERLKPGISFSVTYILRTAIILYGFRITFQNIIEVGAQGLAVSIFMVVSTFLLGILLGKKLFKMDADLAILTAAGSAVCGAAAVLATESVLKADRHKSAIAVSTVVLFGTISMFIYPVLLHAGLLMMNEDAFGIFIGGSIHEVAQVVVAGNAVSEAAANSGIIVKMTRVMMLVPLLLVLGLFIMKQNKALPGFSENKFPIPYFVLGFILVAGINSLDIFSQSVVASITVLDTFLLTMAMCALGMGTNFSKFRQAGSKPIYLAGLLFIWLLVGGCLVTKCITYF